MKGDVQLLYPFKMVEQFKNYVREQNLFDTNSRVLLTVSGGVDSVAMFECFRQAGPAFFGVAHCNFGLRGKESDEDERFVKELAQNAKIPFYTTSFLTEEFAKKEGLSIQMAARKLRYTWFEKICNEHGYDFIATAHHQNDVLETVLFNLTKGTGIAGLHGIRSKTGRIIRPILFAAKSQILDFGKSSHFSWREDSSNDSTKYARNLLRHEVIPRLKKINPDLELTFQNTVERISQVEEVFEKYVEKAAEDVIEKKGGDVYLNIAKVLAVCRQPVVLHELLKPYGVNYTQSKDLVEALPQQAGKIFETPTHLINIDREYIIVSEKYADSFRPGEITKDQIDYHNDWLTLELKIIEGKLNVIPRDSNLAFLDLDKLTFPLGVRTWRQGDYFFPLGMRRKKKLSDFMIDEKIPLNLKERVFLLTSGDDIVWVIGHRIDDRYKISDETTRIFSAEIINKKG